jgi:pimeloyl-ACP methyl ester carboxylesterase
VKFKRQYIDLRGQKIWSSRHKKKGEKVLLLHGGMSQTEGFDKRISPAIKGFNVFAYDRAGHGRTPDVQGSFHFDFQMKEAIAYLEDIVKEPAHLIGYSDGGIISMLVAIHRPDLVKSLTLIGANYNTDTGIPSPEAWEPSPEDRAKYAHFSPDAPETLDAKIQKMVQIWATEPNMTISQLATIKAPTLVIAGDDDLHSIKHTYEMYENIPNSRLAIIPGASHLIDKDQPELLTKVIRKFLKDTSYPVTLMPVRRNQNVAE